MKVELLDQYSSDNPDKVAAFAARTCYSEDSPVEASFEDMIAGARADGESAEAKHEALLERLIRRGHYSVFEHPKAVFAIEGVSRACMAQITRHRHLSFSVQSQRYVNFDDAEMYDPKTFDSGVSEDVMDEQVGRYNELVESGVPEEDARMVLPIGTKVNMVVSGNARAWMHVVDMRHAGDAQGEIRELSGGILDGLHEWAPKTFELYEEHAKGASKKAP